MKDRNPWIGRVIALLAASALPAGSGSAQSVPSLWGELEPGPHPVGYRVEYRYDPGRVELPETRLDGSPETRPIERRMQIGLWYPAEEPTGSRVRLQDYIDLTDYAYLADDRRPQGVLTPEDREELLRSFARRPVFRGADSTDWSAVRSEPLAAVRNAKPASGPFPLVVLAPGSGGSLTEHAILAEHLASHGYVVVGTPSRGLDVAGGRAADLRVVESQVRDMEYAIAHAAALPYVNPRALGTIGFSLGGYSAVLLQMRNPAVDAVVSLDGSTGLGTLDRSPFFDLSRATAPILHFHSDSRPGPAPYFEPFRYADVSIFTVRGLHHLDFADFAPIHTFMGVANEHTRSSLEHVRTAHAWINRYIRYFLDAHVKRSPERLALLEDGSGEAGAPTDIFSLVRRKGEPPPPSAAHLYELMWRPNGIVEAAGIIRDTRRREPGWVPFSQRAVNMTGVHFTEIDRLPEAVAVFELNTELYPKSSAAHLALARTYERVGKREEAIRSLRQALELDPKNAGAERMFRELTRSGDSSGVVRAGGAGLAAAIDGIAREALEEGPLAGMTILVARGAETVLAQGYGVAELENGTPATAETVYGVASLTKQFTAAVILRLAEEDRLDLDDPLARFFPDLSNAGQITVRQLLDHTAGLRNGIGRERRLRGHASLEFPREELIRLYGSEPSASAPGETWGYSNIGYTLLGAIVEKVSGQSYGEYLREHILAPLGLEATQLWDPHAVIRHRAVGYNVGEGRFSPGAWPHPSQQLGNVGLYSSARDLAKWQQALASGRVIGRAAYERMTSPDALADGTIPDYGLGLAVGELQGLRKISHVGFGGGFSSVLAYYPERELAVVVLTNTFTRNLHAVERRIARAALELAEPNDLPLAQGELARYPGEYRSGPLRARIVEEGGRLRMEAEGLSPYAFTFLTPVYLLHQGDGTFLTDFDGATRLSFVGHGRTASALLIRQGDRTLEARRVETKP